MRKLLQHNLLWGFIAVGVFVATFVWIYRVKPPALDTMRLSATFQDVGGLKKGSKVLLAGLPVGEVTAIDLTEDLEVKINLIVDSTLEIPDDSDLRISTSGLFAEPQLSLSLGGGFDSLVNGDEIEYTQSSVDFLKLFEQIIDAASPEPASKE